MSPPTVPGDAQQEKINAVLPQLSRPMRTAFAAACAERVLPVAEAYFRGRRDVLKKAIELAWAYALGEKVDKAEIRETVAKCEKMVDKLYDNDEGGSATLYALNAISFALQSTTKVESTMAEDAASFASDAAATGDIEHGKEHIQEESEWQEQALDVAKRAAKPTRTMFQDLPPNPRWLQLFRAHVVPD